MLFTKSGFVAWLALLVPLALPAAPAEVVIDNDAPGFSQAGFELLTNTNSLGGTARVHAGTAATTAFARYSPHLTGQYDVFLYWGNFPDRDRTVNWTIQHQRGATIQPFNQRANPGWHFHGTYYLQEDSAVELRLKAISEGGWRQDAPVVADAVKFVPTVPRIVTRSAKDTLTPVTLNHGDELHFRLRNGNICPVKLVNTGGTQGNPYTFWAELDINGAHHRIERIVPTQASFYEPLETQGLRLWLDAVSDIFRDDGGWMREKDVQAGIACRPQRKARLVVNDVHDRICPESLTWWYPETKDHLDVRECYNGEDVWMGTYGRIQAHGGLDLNMKSGTPLFAPIAFDDQYYFDSLAAGDINNRWRGVRTWANGSTWWLQSHHLNKLLVSEHQPLERGINYAETAGVHVGTHQHTHFTFRVFEEGESYFLDPWILFWQMFKDHPVKPTPLLKKK